MAHCRVMYLLLLPEPVSLETSQFILVLYPHVYASDQFQDLSLLLN